MRSREEEEDEALELQSKFSREGFTLCVCTYALCYVGTQLTHSHTHIHIGVYVRTVNDTLRRRRVALGSLPRATVLPHACFRSFVLSRQEVNTAHLWAHHVGTHKRKRATERSSPLRPCQTHTHFHWMPTTLHSPLSTLTLSVYMHVLLKVSCGFFSTWGKYIFFFFHILFAKPSGISSV